MPLTDTEKQTLVRTITDRLVIPINFKGDSTELARSMVQCTVDSMGSIVSMDAPLTPPNAPPAEGAEGGKTSSKKPSPAQKLRGKKKSTKKGKSKKKG